MRADPYAFRAWRVRGRSTVINIPTKEAVSIYGPLLLRFITLVVRRKYWIDENKAQLGGYPICCQIVILMKPHRLKIYALDERPHILASVMA